MRAWLLFKGGELYRGFYRGCMMSLSSGADYLTTWDSSLKDIAELKVLEFRGSGVASGLKFRASGLYRDPIRKRQNANYSCTTTTDAKAYNRSRIDTVLWEPCKRRVGGSRVQGTAKHVFQLWALCKAIEF